MTAPERCKRILSWCPATGKAVGIALVAFLSPSACALAQESMTVGHPSGRSVTYKRVSSSLPGGSALSLTAEQLKALSGCHITAVQVELSEAVSPDSLTIFIARTPEEGNLFEMHPSSVKTGVNDITLTTPFVIEESESLAVGYTLRGVKNLCYAGTLATGPEWIRNKSDNQWRKFDNTSYSACVTLTVEGENLPEDVRLTHFAMPEYALTSQALHYEGEFVNLGAATVKELQCTYYVDGEKSLVEKVEGLDIAPRTRGAFTLSAFSFPTECERAVQVELSAVNGKADALLSDNRSRTQQVVCRDEFARKKVLMEVFSTEKCTNCPSAHEYLDKLFEGKDNLIEVGHHAGFYTDALTVPASSDYEWFYKPGRLYAPAVMFDRTNRGNDYPEAYADSVPVTSAVSQYTLPLYEASSATPAIVSVALQTDYDSSSRHLTVGVSGSQLLPVEHLEKARLFVMLTEDSIFSTTQAGASKGFYHRHALRSMLSGTWGDGTDLANGYSAFYETDIPEEWDAEKVRAVAFVACYDENDRNNCRVLGAEAVNIATCLPLGMGEAVERETPEIQLDEQSLFLAGEGTFSLFDTSGRCVARGVRSMPRPVSGVYVALISTRFGTKSAKLAL